jgi:hypothetical protein
MLRKASRLAACGSFVIVILAAASAAAAPDAHAVADALVAAFNASGKAEASYSDAVASGDTITITGFKAVQPKRSNRDMAIATIVVAGAAERQPGGFTAASMTFSDGSTNDGKAVVKWQTAVVANAVVPTPEEIKGLSNKFLPFTTATVSGIAISDPQLAQPIDIAKVDLAMAADANGEPNSVTFSTTGVHVPASAFDAPEVKGMMQGLGYTDLVLSVTFDMGFDTGADTMALRSFSLDITDVGKLAVSGAFSNVKVHAMVGAASDGTPAPKQVPSLDKLTVRFDNAGVIERALDMQAQILGTSREDVASQWPMLLMFMIGDAGGMDFQQKVQTAVTAFLQSPKSLTVTLAPAAPVPFDKVAATLGEDQTKLPDLLGVQIDVNN